MKYILKCKENVVLVLACIMPFTLNLLSTNYFVEDNNYINVLIFVKYLDLALIIISIIVDIVKHSFTKRGLILFICVFALFGYLTYRNSDFAFRTGDEQFIYFLVIIACKNIDYRKILYGMFVSNICFLVVLFVFTLLYIVSYYYDIEGTTRVRFRMGKHPNSVAYTCIYLFFVYIYLNKHHIRHFDYIMLFIINFVLFYLLGTKSVFLIVNLFLFILLVSRYINICLFNHKWYQVLFVLLPIICFFSVFILSYFYKDDVLWMTKINRILNGRIALAHNAVRYNGIKLFEYDLQYRFQEGDYYVDFSLLMFAIRYGIVMLMVLLSFLTYFAFLILKKKDIVMSIIFILFIIFTSFNDDFFNLIFNIILFVPSYRKDL